MPRSLLALLLAPLLAVAAPVPKTGGVKKIEDVFGTPAELPGVTCEMTRRDELKASIGKDAASADLSITNTVRPLATRTVVGDFELTVRVTHSPPEKADLAVGTGTPTVHAGIGLFAEGNPKHTLNLLHKHIKQGDSWRTGMRMSMQYTGGGSGSTRQGNKLEDQPVYLRLTRTGDEFKSETSSDGKKWLGFGTSKVKGFGGSVVVGPHASHNTSAGYEVTFDEYVIKTPEEKK